MFDFLFTLTKEYDSTCALICYGLIAAFSFLQDIISNTEGIVLRLL